MNGAQVRVLEQTNEIGFSRFLEGKDGGGLEAKVVLEVLSNLTDEALERGLANQEFGRLLVLAARQRSRNFG